MKQLTEERENLTVDFKEENDELKNKIKALERELTNNQYNHKQQQLNNNNKQSNNKLTSDTMSSLSDGKLKLLLIWPMFLI